MDQYENRHGWTGSASSKNTFLAWEYPVLFLCLANTFESEQTDICECRTDLAKQFKVDLIKIVVLFFFFFNPSKTLRCSGGLELHTSVKDSCCKNPWVQPQADIATWWHTHTEESWKALWWIKFKCQNEFRIAAHLRALTASRTASGD